MEVLRHLDLKLIQFMRFETCSTVGRLKGLERAAAMPIVCKNNSRILGDLIGISQTTDAQFPPLDLVVV